MPKTVEMTNIHYVYNCQNFPHHNMPRGERCNQNHTRLIETWLKRITLWGHRGSIAPPSPPPPPSSPPRWQHGCLILPSLAWSAAQAVEPVNCFVSVAVALGGFKSECIDLEINREHWVPVVVGDLRNDTLHDGCVLRCSSALLPICSCEAHTVSTTHSLLSANSAFYLQNTDNFLTKCWMKIFHPYINISLHNDCCMTGLYELLHKQFLTVLALF